MNFENYIYILRKNSNPKYWVLEKNDFWKKKETPAAYFAYSVHSTYFASIANFGFVAYYADFSKC